jgi:catechol 2,3-dioxygenase-like lactoylglutathione lyase family enzyme
MTHNRIEKFGLENLQVERRKLLQALGWTASAFAVGNVFPGAARAFSGAAAEAMPAGTRVFPVTTINHLSCAVADYARSRDFYIDLFDMRLVWDNGKGCALEFGSMTSPNGMYIRKMGKSEDKPTVNHIAYGIKNFMSYKSDMKAELERRQLTNIRPDSEVGWICNDPKGYMLNVVPEKDKAMFPGAADPCDVAASTKCTDAAAEGLKNLEAPPKPSGKGFKAEYYSYVTLNVPADAVESEMEFYRDMFGMKVIYQQANDNPEAFLRFGQNTLFLRPTQAPGEKPYCTHFGFVVENFSREKVKAELERRGLDPKADSKLAWTVSDPDGFQISVAAAGLPEHLAKACHGESATCPAGA